MTSDTGKENIADGLVAGSYFPKASVPSPKKEKSSRRTRSKSIGPGALGALEEPVLKESNGNRRKSAFIPAVKSILASNDEDEKKRREARRKSLAKRRVSFAPEATLHTWDVVEYLRDATSSSASSEASRRASNVSQASSRTSPAPDSDADEPPSTPPEQLEEPEPEQGSSPANQRDLHQKKRRRSSGIPPMNFNNPDDIYSSSPLSGENSSPMKLDEADRSDEDEEDAAMKINNSMDSNDSTESSARLDAALRQAVTHAGTQRLDLDDEDDDDMSMELAEDEITASFKPWAKRSVVTPSEDQENMDPFLPSRLLQPNVTQDQIDEEDEENDMSMDITRAMGRIVPGANGRDPESPTLDDMSMELTMPLGTIQAINAKEPADRRKSLKRRASLQEASQGSPAKRPSSRRTSLRHRASVVNEIVPSDDQTMDFTVAIGAIQSGSTGTPTEMISDDAALQDETMDFTVAVGTIKPQPQPNVVLEGRSAHEDEDMSMEFTSVIGGIKNLPKSSLTPQKIATPIGKAVTTTKSPTPRKLKTPDGNEQIGAASTRMPQQAARTTPKQSPRQPTVKATTPVIPPPSEQIERFEPSPFVRKNQGSAQDAGKSVSTPPESASQVTYPELPNDPIAAPILQRRRSSLSSVQFSPLASAREEPPLKSTALLSSNIKLLSTPRKQTLTSPIKRGTTPNRSQTPQKTSTPKQKTPTPKKTPRKSISPKKRVVFGEEPSAVASPEPKDNSEPEEEVERISLQEFLDLTKIRFMDLSTTKRRHTAAPAAFRDTEVDDTEDSLDRYVVAAACTLPEFELYQHACHEMKKYISDGRHFVRTMEANVLEENPLLFSEYLTAPPDQRTVMDNQFKNLKTSARLEARGEWYSWRSTLLGDLKTGLLGTMTGLLQDEKILAEKEGLLDKVLPPLEERHDSMDKECKVLQQRHDELNSCDREELEQARQQLLATDAELAGKRALLAQLQEELLEKEERIEAAKERKVECLQEIKAAERVREECRGWSTSEVNLLKTQVSALEHEHGWSITSASANAITMTYRNDLELYLQPSAFATGVESSNASISLSYIGDSATPHSRSLTTSKRFFLQLIRAHLHCITQSQTRIADLLLFVKNGWSTALKVAEGVRWLEHNYITEESILSDERMSVTANMLLPTLQTKVRCSFEIGVILGFPGMETTVDPRASIVYGEKYKADKMRDFLKEFCGEKLGDEGEMMRWADAVLDLAGRLKATGRKGERA